MLIEFLTISIMRMIPMKNKKPIPSGPKGKGIKALKAKAPEVAARMGYKNGGCVMSGRGGSFKGNS
tara:strand:- start:1683 stop:1880 length:198 start_codon:yes stop_codon:yes gene_type:complete